MVTFNPEDIIIRTENLFISYGDIVVIKDFSIEIPKKKITAIIGPSGCGKTTLIKSFNRMLDFIPNIKIQGKVYFHDIDIYSDKVDPYEIRKKIGMVFQKPNPFPKTIYKNVIWGRVIDGYKGDKAALAEEMLKKAALWEEVKDKLNKSGLELSGGQQQRLCIARALAMEPEVLLLDEPCSALDPIATSKIEDLLYDLKDKYTFVIVTHNISQAARISDYTAFVLNGELIEYDETKKIFVTPKDKRLQDYLIGHFK